MKKGICKRDGALRCAVGGGIAVVFAAFLASAPSAGATSLEEAVRASLENPLVGEAKANRRAIDADLREAQGLYYPTLDMRGAVGPARVDSPTTRATDSGEDWLFHREASLVLVQRLFDGGSTINQVERQEARVKAAAAQVLERSEFVGLDAVQAYLDVLRQIELVRFAEANLQGNLTKREDVQSRVEAGRSGVGDQRQAESRVAQARSELVNARRRLDQARAFYQRVVGTEPMDLSRPGIPADSVPQSLQSAIALAQKENPSVRAASLDISAADAQVRVDDGLWAPQVDLELSATQGADIGGLRGDNDSYSAMVVARWNFYSGGSHTARRSGSIARAMEARERLRSVTTQSEEEARRTWSALVRLREQVDVLRERVTSGEGVLDAYNQQFVVGQRDLLDVLDAQNDLFAAQTDLTTAEYSLLFANYRLLALTGRLMTALNVEPPDEAEGGRVSASSPPAPPER